MLKGNRTLTGLDLMSNQIGDEEKKLIDHFIHCNNSIRDQLHQAVQQGDLQQVKSLLQQGVSLLSITGENDNGSRPPTLGSG